MGIPRHGEFQPEDSYLLPGHWCFHIYSYHGTLELNGESFPLAPGTASIIPPGTPIVYRYTGPSEHVYFHFRPGQGGRQVEIPSVLPLGDAYEEMDGRARRAVSQSMIEQAHARAALWSLLWDCVGLNRRPRVDTYRFHPLVEAAIRQIEQILSDPIRVDQLCLAIGVSHGYLSRLFHREFGYTVLEYVRRRRSEHALHLLQSTTLPVKAIARAVGVPNLSQFSRLMRETQGASPRQLRAGPAED